jgi:8-oxo-dGTP diphosphatase
MGRERFYCLGACALILERKGKVLLMRRANTGFGDGWYGLPGGGLNGNEPMKVATCREAKEELGIDICPKDLRYVCCLHIAPHFRTTEEVLMFCFKAIKWKGRIQNAEPDRCDDITFFDLKKLPHNILEGSHQCLKNYQTQEAFSELHWKSGN